MMEEGIQTITKTTELPDDVATLQALVVSQAETTNRLTRRVEELEELIHRMKHWLYGKKSEKVLAEQMLLFPDPDTQAPPESDVEEEPTRPLKRVGHGRKKLPEDLPRVVHRHELPVEDRTCPGCGECCPEIGVDSSERLEYTPACLSVERHDRVKYACKCGEKIFTADVPAEHAAVIDKGLPGPGLLAHILVSKYEDHLPLNRQERMLGRFGVEFSRSTLCDWVGACADLLQPIYDELKSRVLSSPTIFTDDTPVSLLGKHVGRTATARMWVYIGGDPPITVYDFSPDRRQDWPQAFLNDYEGSMHADAYPGYRALCSTGKIQWVACWAHARRYFHDRREVEHLEAHTALGYIGALYRVEKDVRGETPDVRKRARRQKAKPILKEFRGWLEGLKTRFLPRSEFGKAIDYTLGHWAALNRYVTDGNLEIDNNEAERKIRPLKLGENNWLFIGSEAAGHKAAVICSIIASCKDAKISASDYLKDILVRIRTTPQSRIETLLPHLWQDSTAQSE